MKWILLLITLFAGQLVRAQDTVGCKMSQQDDLLLHELNSFIKASRLPVVTINECEHIYVAVQDTVINIDLSTGGDLIERSWTIDPQLGIDNSPQLVCIKCHKLTRPKIYYTPYAFIDEPAHIVTIDSSGTITRTPNPTFTGRGKSLIPGKKGFVVFKPVYSIYWAAPVHGIFSSPSFYKWDNIPTYPFKN